MNKTLAWIIGIGILIAGLLAALLALDQLGMIDSTLANLILAGSLVVVSYAYGSLALLSMLDARERGVRPVISLELASTDHTVLPAFGILVRNCGLGPALDVSLDFHDQPGNPAFRMAGLRVVRDGIPVLDKDHVRFISGGQPYSTLTQMDDGHFRVTVRYWSIMNQEYSTTFTLKPQPDHHLLRSSIPKFKTATGQ